MKAGKAPFSQQLDEAIYRKPGGVGKESFMRLQVHVQRADKGSLGQHPGPLSPSAVGQGEPPALDTSPTANAAGESSLNHPEG